MEFTGFRTLMQKHIIDNLFSNQYLFTVDVDQDLLWNTYLDSYLPEYNPIFRERRAYDCNCCRRFIRDFGHVVAIVDGKTVSIWDFVVNDPEFSPVVKVMSKLVNSKPIKDVFLTSELKIGVDHNFEDSVPVTKWSHFCININPRYLSQDINRDMSQHRDTKNVFKRSLEELSVESIDIVLDLISQNSLYKGEEWKGPLTILRSNMIEYSKLKTNNYKDLFCWVKSTELGPAIGRIRNHSIGTLLIDISEDVDLDLAVKKYEKIVAPSNYHRPKAIYTSKMIEQAQKEITDLGYLDSLGRRHATVDDITINNVLFANRDVKQRITTGDVFSEMKKEKSVNTRQFNHVDEISIEKFISEILPNVTNIELLLENRHESNLMSVIGPKMKDAPSMFKWNNPFSWAYNGNITDSMKQNVKAAGGNVDGVLRFSIQWNENGDNNNDFDAHCVEQFPRGAHIHYQNKMRVHPSSGMLDVDIVHPDTAVAVENIIYTDLNKMPDGIYKFQVHVFSHRGGQSGFRAEIEFDGQVYSYDYKAPCRQKEIIDVAWVKYSKHDGFEIIKSLPSNMTSKEIWGLSSGHFIPVSMLMFSPNYWDAQSGIGNKHYFFILQGCLNDTTPNGFFNEFLISDLLKHKRVFEALGGKMKVDFDERQLSGLGFSSTQKNSVICKLEGTFNRTIKLVF